MIASVCGTDVGAIKAVVEEAGLDEYARSEALNALTIVMLDGRLSRDQLVTYHSYLLERRLEREHAYVH